MVAMELLFFVTAVILAYFAQSGVLAERLSSRSDHHALYSLRSSLGIRAYNWPRRTDPCTVWTGVVCEGGRVTGLMLTGLRRTKRGNASASFAVDGLRELTRLSIFNSTDFSLPGVIPDWFGTSLNGSLTVMDIRRASINGSLPDSLGNLIGLEILSLSGNQLTGDIPENLEHLKKLTALDLSLNGLSGSIPMSVGKLSKLRVLDLSANFLHGLIPPQLMGLPRLKSLVLSKNNFSGSIPGVIGDFSHLITLDLSHNNLSGPFPVELNGTVSLKVLNLGNNSLSGALQGDIFTNLPRLTSLVLCHNDFSDVMPNSFWALPELQSIDVSYNNFTGVLPYSFANLSASVLEIDLSHNFYYGHLPVGSEKLIKNLQYLDISYNYFDSDMPFRKGANVSVQQNCFSEHIIDQRSAMDCRSFYDSKGVNYVGPVEPSSSPSPSPSSGNKTKRFLFYALEITFGALSLVAFLGFVLWSCRRHGAVSAENKTNVVALQGGGFPQVSSTSFPSSLGSLTYDKIQQATLNFSANLFMKKGHSGEFYHGNLENGTPIVVKKIDNNVAEKEIYLVELDVFTRLSHTRLAPYLGHYLANESEKFIVYKYLPNADLVTAFYTKSTQDEDEIKSLDWIKRQKIAIGVAEALVYLHHECVPPIVHRDVQASSVLLDDKFEVRLGSLSEACAQEVDGQPNVITRLFRPSQSSGTSSSGSNSVTFAYDIYCFGKVLLELVTGRLGISACDDASVDEKLAEIMPYIDLSEKDLIINIMDPTLIVDEDLTEEVLAMAIVAKSCLHPRVCRRPPMKAILKVLQNPLEVTREGSVSGSSRMMSGSSQGSWNMSLFGSCRSFPDIAEAPVPHKETPESHTTNSNAIRCTKSLEGIQASPVSR